MRFQLLTIIVLLSAWGCGNSAKPPTSGPSCEAQISDLSEWMARVKKEAVSHPNSFSDVDPPVADVSTVRAMNHMTMTLASEAVLVEGMAVVAVSQGAIDPSEFAPDTASVKKLSVILRSMKEEHESIVSDAGHTDIDTQTLNLVIDKQTSWNVVVASINSASVAGYSKLEIIFKTPSKVSSSTPPLPSSLTNEIAALRKYAETVNKTPASDHSTLKYEGYSYLGLLAKLSNTCPALKEVVDSVGKQDPDKRQAHLTDGVVSAIKNCQCKVEIPAVKELYWYSANDGIGIPSIGSIGVSLASSETDDAVVVQAVSDSTWQDVHTKVLSLTSSGEAMKVVFKVEKSQ